MNCNVANVVTIAGAHCVDFREGSLSSVGPFSVVCVYDGVALRVIHNSNIIYGLFAQHTKLNH